MACNTEGIGGEAKPDIGAEGALDEEEAAAAAVAAAAAGREICGWSWKKVLM